MQHLIEAARVASPQNKTICSRRDSKFSWLQFLVVQLDFLSIRLGFGGLAELVRRSRQHCGGGGFFFFFFFKWEF